MSGPPLSPSSLAKRCFGASDNEDEELVLTPEQRPSSEPAGSPRVSPAHTQPPPPPTDTHPPLSKKPKLDAAYIKARFDAYEQSKQRKDFKGKIKSSSTSAPKGGNSRPALQPAYPPPYNQFNHGYTATAPQHPCYSEAAPPPPHRHWGSRGRFSGYQTHPSYTYPHAGYSQDVPHHSPHPSCSHSQHHGHGHEPHMDENRHNTHSQQG